MVRLSNPVTLFSNGSQNAHGCAKHYLLSPRNIQADVSFEDQKMINAFSRMNLKINELKARLAAKKRAIEDLEEAENELMLLDDETVPYAVGECIAHLPKDEVEERLQKLQEDTKTEENGIQEQVEKIAAQMEEYKGILYAKFGNSINLEE
jgi:prefoldin subunit 4